MDDSEGRWQSTDNEDELYRISVDDIMSAASDIFVLGNRVDPELDKMKAARSNLLRERVECRATCELAWSEP